MRRDAFMFTVQGTEQTGVIYVTKSYEEGQYDSALDEATKTAVKRSGDPAPKFIRTVPPTR